MSTSHQGDPPAICPSGMSKNLSMDTGRWPDSSCAQISPQRKAKPHVLRARAGKLLAATKGDAIDLFPERCMNSLPPADQAESRAHAYVNGASTQAAASARGAIFNCALANCRAICRIVEGTHVVSFCDISV